MNGIVIVLVAAVVLVAGYLLYGRWLARTWGIDAAGPHARASHGGREELLARLVLHGRSRTSSAPSAAPAPSRAPSPP